MKYLALVPILILTGCLSTHNTDGKSRPDQIQHIAHISSYNGFVKKTLWKPESPSSDDKELNLMLKQADEGWENRNLPWSEYQDKAMGRDVAPVRTSSKLF